VLRHERAGNQPAIAGYFRLEAGVPHADRCAGRGAREPRGWGPPPRAEPTLAAAHHSIFELVDTQTVVDAELPLAKVDWVNPHAWFHFTATKGPGQGTADVMIEWLSLPAFRQAGYRNPGAFPIGHTYKVSYNPNRDGSLGGFMVRMVDTQTGQVYEAADGFGVTLPDGAGP
jgi:hypothetical protein